AYFIEKIVSWEWRWIKPPIDIPLAVLLIVVLFSTLFSTDRYTSVWSLGLLVNYVAVFYLIIHSITTRSQLRRLLQTIVYVAVFLSIFGLIKKSGANPFPWWEYDIGLNREISNSSSTYGNPNHFAGYLAMALPVCVGMFLTGQKEFQKVLTGLFTILILLGLIFALSRGGWMSSFFGMAFMGGTLLFASKSNIFSKKYLLIMAGSLFFIGLVFLFSTPAVEEVLTLKETSEDASLQSRILVWRHTIKMIADYPTLGSGPGTYATVFTQYQPPGILGRYYMAHNDYLHFISETGLPVLVIMGWLTIVVYRFGFKKLAHPSRLVRGSTLGALAGISAILLYSVSDFNLHIPANAVLFSVLAAIAVSQPPKLDDTFPIADLLNSRITPPPLKETLPGLPGGRFS
ncbi:MAG: O-antigen ligase family protein, partial [Desulfobacterales bacterium]